MILLVAQPGSLIDGVQHSLEARGIEAKQGTLSDDDLFMSALNCAAIVYLPEANLLNANIAASPNPERMRALLKASNAPGVKLLIILEPTGQAYEIEEQLLKTNGIPYVIVRSPSLLEELAKAVDCNRAHSLWIARGQSVKVASENELFDTIHQALTADDLQGRTVEVGSQTMALEKAIEKAVSLKGGTIHVHATWPFLSKLMTSILRLFGAKQPRLPALALAASC